MFLDVIASQEPALSLTHSVTKLLTHLPIPNFCVILKLQTADSRNQAAKSRQQAAGSR